MRLRARGKRAQNADVNSGDNFMPITMKRAA